MMTTTQIRQEIESQFTFNEVQINYFSDAVESAYNCAVDATAKAFDLTEVEFWEDGIIGDIEGELKEKAEAHYFRVFRSSLEAKAKEISAMDKELTDKEIKELAIKNGVSALYARRLYETLKEENLEKEFMELLKKGFTKNVQVQTDDDNFSGKPLEGETRRSTGRNNTPVLNYFFYKGKRQYLVWQ